MGDDLSLSRLRAEIMLSYCLFTGILAVGLLILLCAREFEEIGRGDLLLGSRLDAANTEEFTLPLIFVLAPFGI